MISLMKIFPLRKLAPVVLALAFFASSVPQSILAVPQAQAAKCAAESVILSAGKAYDRAARAGTSAAFASALAQFSDMKGTAMFALGRYRKLLPKAREAEYIALTRKFMGDFMLEYGKGFRASSLTITECSDSSVSAKLEDGSRVKFRVDRSGSRYVIRDINVKSIWLVQQMRSTFVGTISREGGDIDALFKYLKS